MEIIAIGGDKQCRRASRRQEICDGKNDGGYGGEFQHNGVGSLNSVGAKIGSNHSASHRGQFYSRQFDLNAVKLIETSLTPSTAQIRTTIEVLEKLGERVNEFAARSVRQIPTCGLSGQMPGQIGRNAMGQTKQVQEITELLKTWHGELEHRRKQTTSYYI